MKYIWLVLAVLLAGCGGSGSDACSVVSASGDNSQAACSTGGGIDQILDQSGDDDEELDPECERICLERGNAAEGLAENDCYLECLSGLLPEQQDDDEESEEVVKKKPKA